MLPCPEQVLARRGTRKRRGFGRAFSLLFPMDSALPVSHATDAGERARCLRRIRRWLGAFTAGLVLSGVTAFPLVWEVEILARILRWPIFDGPSQGIGLTAWIDRVLAGLRDNAARYPFMAYGTDWLAFGHLVIASAFWGPWRDPVRNKWVIEWGMIACVGVVPLALICGPIRGIPLGWRLIDMAFGVFGILPLLIIRRDIARLEALPPERL